MQPNHEPLLHHPRASPSVWGRIENGPICGTGQNNSNLFRSSILSNVQQANFRRGPARLSSNQIFTHHGDPNGDTPLVGIPPDKGMNPGKGDREGRQTTSADGLHHQRVEDSCKNVAPRIPQWAESWAHPNSTYDCAKSMGGHVTLNFMTVYSDIDHQDMKILGAGIRDFMSTLKEHIKMQRPQIVVLLETHISGSRADNVCKRISFSSQYRVDVRGFQGGMWVLWLDNQVQLNLIEAHIQFITIEVVVSGTRSWLFTAIYASPHSYGREELWKKLEGRASTTNRPWLLAGDFNETKTLDERDHRGADMARRCSKSNNWIENNALLDIGFTGPKFTWVRGRNPSTRKSARLDRVLCNVAWRHKFQDGGVRHLVRHQSNHAPILISLEGFTPRVEEVKPF
ncbi:LOW QUALITY PROTEIN: hypothetical protein Cgig2_021182 [Carnegiea gigantea]|uniref:Endonuclease/exonuclease/phosphatase domain-containing protein n=1 Tax=Carnegiea gigantea TaxID=171969 RepID=A0A9Q1KVL0_9CARY|nr:LOW QUALITY PROTEIN: hypothetical protein Cgig2_021182 [Carnegiea gigantea]